MTLDFNAGITEVFYFITDANGNTDSCSYLISIIDDQAPQVECKPTTIFIHPSGLQSFILDPSEIDNGSFDNCALESFAVVPPSLTCASAGTTQTVQLIVIDTSGNSDSCFSDIKVEVEPPQPEYILGICESDTLKLFAGAPEAPPNTYSYNWSGPNNFTSILENPVIPSVNSSASGSYTVVITGFNGCSSTGNVEVVVDALNSPSLQAEVSQICLGQSIILQASAFNQPVNYMWFRGLAPNGLLLGTTISPSFIDVPPLPGDYSYYVIVESAGCMSNPSQTVPVSVVNQPDSEVNDLFIHTCEGSTVQLGTPITGFGYTYLWSGPNGFSSTQQLPPAITDVQELNEGIYTLVISLGDCISDPAMTELIVDPRPGKPIISGDSVFCHGASLILNVNNIENADQYVWQHPNGSEIQTIINTLTLNNISENEEGIWTVTAVLDDCVSENSESFEVNIENALLISATNSGPVCFGDNVCLQVPVIPGVSYQWEGPDNFESDIPDPCFVPSPGIYTVTVTTPSGCEAIASTTITVDTAPSITALSNSSGICSDGTQDAFFESTVFPPDNGSYTYLWTGPNEFTSNDSLLIIENISELDNGMYILTVFQGMCPSIPDTTVIDVTDIPPSPDIDGISNWCEGDTLILTAVSSEGQNATYHWNTPVGDYTVEGDSLFILPAITINALGDYSVAVSKNGCTSDVSDPFQIIVTEILDQPNAYAPERVCVGDSLTLTTDYVEGASFQWSGPNDFSASSQSPFRYFSGHVVLRFQMRSLLRFCKHRKLRSW
jgi:hypothetical protein